MSTAASTAPSPGSASGVRSSALSLAPSGASSSRTRCRPGRHRSRISAAIAVGERASTLTSVSPQLS
jgi:hypothetical protein